MGKQKRSENTYTKINTIFKRDKYNIIMPFEPLVMPELEYMRNCKFDCEEKIDGTNIRIEVTHDITYDDDLNCIWPLYIDWKVEYKGKTDNAQMPKNLLKYLNETFPEEKVLNALGLKKRMYLSQYMIGKDDSINWLHFVHQDAIDHNWIKLESNGITYSVDMTKIPSRYTLYGEGYGAGIQSGGYYQQEQKFIGFDVKVDGMYLLKPNRDEIFNKLGCDIVPFVGQFTIDEAIEYVKKGFNSNIATDTHLAEGLVCRTPMGLTTRRGERIMFKVKTCDWQKYFSKYGTYDKVDQEPNEHY